MTKLAFIHRGVGGTYIKTSVLHQPPKGCPKHDIIYLEIVSGKKKPTKRWWAMTPLESFCISTGLMNALMLYQNRR